MLIMSIVSNIRLCWGVPDCIPGTLASLLDICLIARNTHHLCLTQSFISLGYICLYYTMSYEAPFWDGNNIGTLADCQWIFIKRSCSVKNFPDLLWVQLGSSLVLVIGPPILLAMRWEFERTREKQVRLLVWHVQPWRSHVHLTSNLHLAPFSSLYSLVRHLSVSLFIPAHPHLLSIYLFIYHRL